MNNAISKTGVPWATHKWKPYDGCRRGCSVETCGYDCYGERNFHRYKRLKPEMKGDFTNVTFFQDQFNRSFPKKPGARIFICESTDPEYWTRRCTEMIIDKIRKHPEHSFLMLTKNPLVYHLKEFQEAPQNLWFGVTANNANELTTHQDTLFPIQNNITFVSIEPVKEEIPIDHFDADSIDWLIIGGQSGPGKRFYPRHAYIADLINFCRENKIPLFIKPNLEAVSPDGNMYKYKDMGHLVQQYPEVA